MESLNIQTPIRERLTPDPDITNKHINSLLGDLTTANFDSYSAQVIEWANKSENEKDGRTLIQVIRIVFEKATDNAPRSEMYAQLCRKMMEQISPKVQDDGIKNAEGKPTAGGQLFRKYLLNRCQADFERGWAKKEADVLYFGQYYAAQKARQQGLGLIKLISELFKLQMLTERIMHECVKDLLANRDKPEEERIESLCTLLTTVGHLLDNDKARAHMDVYFQRMEVLKKSSHASSRVQAMLQDVIDLRERAWVTGSPKASESRAPEQTRKQSLKDSERQQEVAEGADNLPHSEPQSKMSNNAHAKMVSARSNSDIMNAYAASEEARWMVMHGQDILMLAAPGQIKKETAYLHTNDVIAFIGPKPYFGQGYVNGSQMNLNMSHSVRHKFCPIFFLGFEEQAESASNNDHILPNPKIAPRFAIDIAELGIPSELISGILDDSKLVKARQELSFHAVAETTDDLAGQDQLEKDILVRQAREVQLWNAQQKARDVAKQCFRGWTPSLIVHYRIHECMFSHFSASPQANHYPWFLYRFWHGIDEDLISRQVDRLLRSLNLENFEVVSERLVECAIMSQSERDGTSLRLTTFMIFNCAIDSNIGSDPVLCGRLLWRIHMKVRLSGIRDGTTREKGRLLSGGELFLSYVADNCYDFRLRCWPSFKRRNDSSTLATTTEAELQEPSPAGEPWHSRFIMLVVRVHKEFGGILSMRYRFRRFLRDCINFLLDDHGRSGDGVPGAEEVKYAITLSEFERTSDQFFIAFNSGKHLYQTTKEEDASLVRQMLKLTRNEYLPSAVKESLKHEASEWKKCIAHKRKF